MSALGASGDPRLGAALDGYPARRSARQVWGDLLPLLADAPPIPVAATFTAEPLLPHLTAELAARGFPRRPEALPFNQVCQLLLADPSPLAKGGEAVVLPRLEELAGGPSDGAGLRAAEDLGAALASFCGRAATRVWLGLFPPPFPRRFEDASTRLPEWYRGNLRLLELAARLPSVRVVDVPAWVAGEAGHDPRMWFLARQPFSEAALARLAAGVARAVAASLRPAAKVLALDCDGVLWHGVCGEDGALGVRIGDEPIGRAHAELQRWCLDMRARGLLLALCSKNNPADVWEVFDRREEMVLRREHLSAASIGWHAKSEGLRRICAELNVGTESAVLLDDNPAEAAEVGANLPEARVLLVPRDIATAVPFLAAQEGFDRDSVTEEDRGRADMTATETRRKEAAAALTPEQFLADLRLVVRVRPVAEESFDRVIQLVQKTNQFNLTTRRHSPADLRRILARPGWRCHTVHVSDRFGDSGLTGVAIAGPEGDALGIDTLLLSCRVLGRGVEKALMAVLVEQARELGLARVQAEFIPTAKNEPAAGYLSSMGFAKAPGAGFGLDLSGRVPDWPPHIRRE